MNFACWVRGGRGAAGELPVSWLGQVTLTTILKEVTAPPPKIRRVLQPTSYSKRASHPPNKPRSRPGSRKLMIHTDDGLARLADGALINPLRDPVMDLLPSGFLVVTSFANGAPTFVCRCWKRSTRVFLRLVGSAELFEIKRPMKNASSSCSPCSWEMATQMSELNTFGATWLKTVATWKPMIATRIVANAVEDEHEKKRVDELGAVGDARVQRLQLESCFG